MRQLWAGFAFEEQTDIGLEAFSKRWASYWDVPLNELLPEAVIELSVVAGKNR